MAEYGPRLLPGAFETDQTIQSRGDISAFARSSSAHGTRTGGSDCSGEISDSGETSSSRSFASLGEIAGRPSSAADKTVGRLQFVSGKMPRHLLGAAEAGNLHLAEDVWR